MILIPVSIPNMPNSLFFPVFTALDKSLMPKIMASTQRIKPISQSEMMKAAIPRFPSEILRWPFFILVNFLDLLIMEALFIC